MILTAILLTSGPRFRVEHVVRTSEYGPSLVGFCPDGSLYVSDPRHEYRYANGALSKLRLPRPEDDCRGIGTFGPHDSAVWTRNGAKETVYAVSERGWRRVDDEPDLLHAVAAAGRFLVGNDYRSGHAHACRWDKGWRPLPGRGAGSEALNVNAQGIVTGSIIVSGRKHPCFWDASGGLHELPLPAGDARGATFQNSGAYTFGSTGAVGPGGFAPSSYRAGAVWRDGRLKTLVASYKGRTPPRVWPAYRNGEDFYGEIDGHVGPVLIRRGRVWPLRVTDHGRPYVLEEIQGGQGNLLFAVGHPDRPDAVYGTAFLLIRTIG